MHPVVLNMAVDEVMGQAFRSVLLDPPKDIAGRVGCGRDAVLRVDGRGSRTVRVLESCPNILPAVGIHSVLTQY